MDEKNQTQENLEPIKPDQTESPASKSVPASESAPAPEPSPEPAPAPKAGKKPSPFRGNKFKRGGMATVMTVVFIAIVVVVNLLVSLLAERFPSLNIDLTAQKMNTLSDQAVELAKGVEEETTIYLIGTEDAYREDRINANYGLKYSQVANLAERLGEVNPKIKTKFIDPDTNPDFINSYPEEYLTSGRVLVKTEKRYKVLTVDDMFSMAQNSQNPNVPNTYSNVDSALAGALEVVNMDKVPVMAIATGHEEMLTSSDMAEFLDMVKRLNFEVKEFDIMTEDIPEGTQLLMIPTPNTDYTDEELDKLRTLLGDQERKESISLLVSCYPAQSELPKLSGFLEEWGVAVGSGSIVAETDSSRFAMADQSVVFVDANSEVLDEDGYSRLLSPMSAPLTLLFEGNGDVGTKALWTTSDQAYALSTEDLEEGGEPQTSQQTLATLSSALTQFDNEFYYRSVMVFGSSHVFTDRFMTTAYGNREYLTDLLQYATDTDGSQVSILTERVQTNVLDVAASQNTIVVLGLGVFTIGLPLVILAAGLVIFLKRRHL